MGASESKQYAKRLSARSAVLLSQYRRTGNAAEDKRLARELAGEPEAWNTYQMPYEVCNPLWERVRQLDPRNPQYTRSHASLCECEARRLAEPAKSQMWARAEGLWAETIRLGDPDFGRCVHNSWAEAVIAQGPHRTADQQAILQRAAGIARHPRDDREDAVAAQGKADWAAAIKHYRTAYSKSGDFDDIFQIALCLVGWKTLNDNEAVQACKDALKKSTAQPPEQDDPREEASQYRRRQVMLAEMVAAAPHYQAALRHEQQNDLDHAIEAGNRAVRAYGCFDTRDLQSRLLLKAGRWTEGSRVLRKGYQHHAVYQKHTTRLAFMYFKERRFLMALSELDYERRRAGVSEEELAQCWETESEYKMAQKEARQTALSALDDPRTSAAELVRVARFFHFERQYAQSIAALRRVIAPDAMNLDAAVHGALADALWASKAQDEAREHYKRALELDPKNLQSFTWRCRSGPRPQPAEYWADVVKWDPCAQHFGAIGLDFNTSISTSEGSIPAWQADEALSMALRLDPDHPDAAEWRDRLQRLRALVERTKQEVALRAAGRDPLDNKIKANAYYSNHGYGVVGSTNQYTLLYGPGGPYNAYTN